MVKLILSFLFVFLFVVTLKAQREEAVTIKTEDGIVYGTLSLPVGVHPVPVVIIHAGSGPTDRDGNNPQMKNNSLKLLAAALQEKGIASLRFDKRLIAASRREEAKEEDLRFEDYINDTRAWIDWLEKDIRFSQIIVAGHSEGALIGLIASINNPAVNKYISIAGSGIPAGQLIKTQLAEQPEPLRKMMMPIVEQLEKGDTVSGVSPILYALFRPSVQPYLISWFRYDPAKEMAKLTIPALVIQGTTDIQVNEKDSEALASAYPAAKEVLILNMNHVLKECRETDMAAQMVYYTTPDIPLHPELIQVIVDFIKGKK